MKSNSNRYAWIFWLSFMVVLFLNLLVWLYVNQVEKTFENELKLRLLSISRMMNRLMDESRFNLLVPGEQNSLSYIYFQNLIESIRQTNDLQSVVLFSPGGRILVAAPELISIQKTTSMTGSAPFRKALEGEYTVSNIEAHAGERFMSAFGPILDADGFVTGLHVIEARAAYFDVLSTLRNRLLLFSFLNFLLVLLVAAALFRAIKRTIHYRTEIRDQEHLVQLGQMAATVAHEVRNPLSIIDGTNDIIRKKYGKNSDELFTYIPKEIERLLTLIQDFLSFARSPGPRVHEFSVKDLTARIRTGLSEEEINRLSFHGAENLVIRSDENLLEQALLNIIQNALQAIKENGEVDVSFERFRRRQLLIRISDTGTGIPEEELERIFEPFYTTREKGTGLGLAVSKRIIEQLGGRIEITSKPGTGTDVIIHLPV